MTLTPPINYSTRISQRAKRVSIRILAGKKVELVVPKSMCVKQAERFLHSKQAWIEQALKRSTEPADEAFTLPQSIVFASLARQWQVEYGDSKNIKEKKQQLILPQANDRQIQHQLKQWLHKQAHEHLVPWLRAVSDELALPFNRVTVRAQKTRWGSCSAKHNININRNLLFLEPEVVRYLFIHELCHTVHLNHRRAYWAMVAKHDPNYQQHDRRLRKAMLDIPAWARP